MHKKYRYTIAFTSWMVFVTWSSLFSFSETDLPRFNFENGDKLVHFTFYFVGVVLGTLGIREHNRESEGLNVTLLKTTLALVVFGIIIEGIQYTFTQDRTGDFFDALANAIGACCGAGVLKIVFRRSKGLNWK